MSMLKLRYFCKHPYVFVVSLKQIELDCKVWILK